MTNQNGCRRRRFLDTVECWLGDGKNVWPIKKPITIDLQKLFSGTSWGRKTKTDLANSGSREKRQWWIITGDNVIKLN